jgi:formiminoglutamase
MTDLFLAANPSLFFSKNDPNDIRLGDLFKSTHKLETLNKKNYAIVGYPDDEGISLNGGRVGAKLAPDSIRQFLYKTTPCAATDNYGFFDFGNLRISDLSLENRHESGKKLIYSLQKDKVNTISFGGGHDYGYADGAGFIKAQIELGYKPVIINLDAHLDVRPTTNGFNSGTPFYRLLSEFKGQFDFYEIGIQPQCNSLTHRKWAQENGAHIYDTNSLNTINGLAHLITNSELRNLTSTHRIFVSFDIDSLSTNEAPGCSQSWITGLKLNDYLNFFNQLSRKNQITGLGIYEVSPPLDFDNQTSKTAALIAYHYIFQGQI